MTRQNLIAEIVTFRPVAGTSDDALAKAAAGLEPFLNAREGFVRRSLSKGTDGLWTDHVVWSDITHARAASEAVMQDPSASGFMALIDPESVQMVHSPILVSQAA